MHFYKLLAPVLTVCFLLTACSTAKPQQTDPTETTLHRQEVLQKPDLSNATDIILSDSGITVGGKAIPSDASAAVYAANDIVYYEAGKGFTYGEGTKADEHSKAEADAHTVVHITRPGVYVLSGKLSAGQIAVDLGKDAEEDPAAVVTLVLKGMDITCTVAPAVIFYNVYECGTKDESKATMEVDTAKAGANVVIADGTENTVNGAYVARIYKSVELNDAGTKVVSSKKLHKYDGAFYSKMSMNLFGGDKGDGVLNIVAQNEGLDTELHLTVNGGNIRIKSGNDGINTNEDGISVTSIRGGSVDVTVTGQTGEGDGIDSNGWLVIDGGKVTASACATSVDAGIDADNGVYIRGGTVVATGNMLDHFEAVQTGILFSFSQRQTGGKSYHLKQGENTVFSCQPVNAFAYLIVSFPELKAGEYTFFQGDTQLTGYIGGMQIGGPQKPGGKEPPVGGEHHDFGGQKPPAGAPQSPGGQQGPNGPGGVTGEIREIFTVVRGANSFFITGTKS